MASREHITAPQWVAMLLEEHRGSAVLVVDQDALMSAAAQPRLRLDPEVLATQHNVAVAVIPVRP